MIIMHVSRWRNVLILGKSSIQLSSSSSLASNQLASLHSTPVSCEKWKNKCNSVVIFRAWMCHVSISQHLVWDSNSAHLVEGLSLEDGLNYPGGNYIRYATRQKRADTKKALKSLLFNNGSSKISFQDDAPLWKDWDAGEVKSKKKSNSKSSTQCGAKAHSRKLRRKMRKGYFSEDLDNHTAPMFQATFGNRWFTWSFNSWKDPSSQHSANGFEWKKHSNWTNHKKKEWDTASEAESDDETCFVGSSSDRAMLGLPSRGPLKAEDVKNAFRVSALKWHPDKHQGPSQAMAEERFKLCVDAYKSLCGALSSV